MFKLCYLFYSVSPALVMEGNIHTSIIPDVCRAMVAMPNLCARL